MTLPSPRYSFRNRRAGGWGIYNVRIIDLAGRIRPLIDRVFPFRELPEAKAYMESDRHVGKIVVKI